MTAVIIASTSGSNLTAIPISSKGIIPLNTTPLKNLGLHGAALAYNTHQIINGHSAGIKITLGSSVIIIGAGDGYEWTIDNKAYADTIFIEELGGAAAIDIGDISYTSNRVKE